MMQFKNEVYAFTDGSGFWSNVQARVRLTQLTVPCVNEDEDFGELRVYFDTATWDISKQGLIYTDEFFMTSVRDRLVQLGFKRAAADDVEYSEQGMQGVDYVSLDVGKAFLDEWLAVLDVAEHL